jgi:hypothetical protein
MLCSSRDNKLCDILKSTSVSFCVKEHFTSLAPAAGGFYISGASQALIVSSNVAILTSPFHKTSTFPSKEDRSQDTMWAAEGGLVRDASAASERRQALVWAVSRPVMAVLARSWCVCVYTMWEDEKEEDDKPVLVVEPE